MNRLLPHAAFAAGALALVWVGAGYGASNPLALTLVALIAAFFVAGALELRRFSAETEALERHLGATTAEPPALATWLDGVPAALRHTVRLRIEGERAALPGPALVPYFAGLLVLLGMLGTFLGMVVTLQGTGQALEHAADVEAIRASLAAPVRGLGLAFGTSVAGVAASAMLGLASALLRRERRRAGRRLDAAIAGPLRAFSRTHQREASLALLQAQAQWLPTLAERLQALASTIEERGRTLDERLLAGQQRFHDDAGQAWRELSATVATTLAETAAASARQAAAAVEPVVQSTMAALERQSATLNETLQGQVQQHLAGVAERLDATAERLAEHGREALDAQQARQQAQLDRLGAALQRFGDELQTRSATLLDGLDARLQAGTERWSAAWQQTLATQHEAQAALAAAGRETVAAAGEVLQRHATALQSELAAARAAADETAAGREAERRAAMETALQALAERLADETRRAAADAAGHQQRVCAALDAAADAVSARTREQAEATIAEIGRLVQAAAEAPRAAAEVIAELRQALSDSLVRDNAALEERNRLLGTLGELLDTVQRAGREQRETIASLVESTGTLLEQAGTRFAAQVETEAQALRGTAAQVEAGAGELAALGEGFGQAVELFARSSEQTTAQLQRIEAALAQAGARSDEQLAYYVAQAREIVDLTLGAQQQAVAALQRRAAEAGA
ncbi:hypothetical protein IWX58_004343 [Rubrivivax gelatinosus]|uniref:DUF802 domain-containing protein n=2 Tax=Rubrivivax gelatinosus TaxID=28068 RepID=UPI0018C8E07F|nr:DUF802 domain-containing protein [Rubrivivax gelatinosus]MBG6082656.1 hypothetical protein [Rubrivivax gelatinosus]